MMLLYKLVWVLHRSRYCGAAERAGLSSVSSRRLDGW